MKEINGVHHWTNRAFIEIQPDDRKLVITDVRRVNELELFRNNKEFQKIRNKNIMDVGMNISAKSELEDLYSIEFSITPPQSAEIALHKDWKLIYGNKILKGYKFFFKNVDFKEISRSKRL